MNSEKKVLALCDLSNESTVLEIKTTSFISLQGCAEQLFYESNGRNCFVLMTDWSHYPKEVSYNIHKVDFIVEEYIDKKLFQLNRAKVDIETDIIKLLSFTDNKSPVRLKCVKCNSEWNTSYSFARKHRPCPNCSSKSIKPKVRSKEPVSTSKNNSLTSEEKLIQRSKNYQLKLAERSNHKLVALSFKDSRSPARVKCLECGQEWERRADHLLSSPYCPSCKKAKFTSGQ